MWQSASSRFRNAEDIAACAEALGASTHRDFEIVICENGGAEAHQKLVSVLPRILPAGQPVHVHLAPGNLGYAGGVNLACAPAPAPTHGGC
jgi:GT2 family glycosyltransferase